MQWNLIGIAIALARVPTISSSCRNNDVMYLGMSFLKKACEESFLKIAEKYKMIVRELEFGPDHVHQFLARSTMYHKLSNTSKEQVQKNFVSDTGNWFSSKENLAGANFPLFQRISCHC